MQVPAHLLGLSAPVPRAASWPKARRRSYLGHDRPAFVAGRGRSEGGDLTVTLRQQAVVTALRKLETEYKATAQAHADAPDYLYYCGKRDAISAAITAAIHAREPERRDPLRVPLIELGYVTR